MYPTTRAIDALTERDTVADRKLRELIGQHTVLRPVAPAATSPAETIAPVGMTREEAAELTILLELANPSLDGDEQAAIERLASALEGTPIPA